MARRVKDGRANCTFSIASAHVFLLSLLMITTYNKPGICSGAYMRVTTLPNIALQPLHWSSHIYVKLIECRATLSVVLNRGCADISLDVIAVDMCLDVAHMSINVFFSAWTCREGGKNAGTEGSV
jgi:hypothetical protein